MKKIYYFLAGLILGWAYGPMYDFDKALNDAPDRENPHGTDDTRCFI